MLTAADFARARGLLGQQAEEDIAWAASCGPPADRDFFASEIIFVICNSGMKNTVARQIFERVGAALVAGRPVIEVFRHQGKAAAIEQIWRDRGHLFREYFAADDQLAFVAQLPWIGDITKYHVAKNFGMQVAKPDVHLQRLADRESCTPQQLCERLAGETGLPVAAVDVVLWRACANGVINSRTGELQR